MKKLWILVALLSVVFLAWCRSSPKNLDSFAQCLTDQWATMYGTESCSYCQKQKKSFGDSFEKIDFVDCAKNTNECTMEEIQGLPTWTFANREKLVWLQTMEALAEKGNCVLPVDES